jgi:hypothetical protein
VDIYRIIFETVNLARYPEVEKLPNSQVPDRYWHEVTTNATDSPWSQYYTLRKWHREDKNFVRNIRLERMVSEPVWESFEPQH